MKKLIQQDGQDTAQVEKQIESELKHFEVTEEARHAAQKSGLSIPEKAPMHERECTLPQDITVIGFQELGALHGAIVNMGCYVRMLTALSDIEREIAEARYDYIKSRAMQALADPNETKVSFTRAKVISHPMVLACQRKLLQAKALHEIHKRKLENYDAMAMAVSREITRRTNEFTQVAKGG